MDDLNDLVWTSPPSSAESPGLRPNARTGSPFSAFDALANTSNRSYSPAPAFNAPASSSTLRPTPAASAPRPGASSDAFASLLSLGSSSSAGGSLSMAEKAAKLADETRRKHEAEAKAFAGQGAFWDKFDGGSSGVAPLGNPVRAQGTGGGLAVPTLTGPARISSPSLVPSRPTSAASNTIRTSTSSIPRSCTPLASSSTHLWSEFDILSAPASTSSPSAIPSNPASARPTKAAANGAPADSFDSFDMFEDLTLASKPAASPSSRSTPAAERTPRTLTPGDHDFGNREDRAGDRWGEARQGKGGLLAGNESDDGDFMGAFDRPAKTAPSRTEPRTSHPSTAPSSSRRPPSPPPHILGQIVEMGFSLTQARNALASTPSGLDVQVALEMLLSESRTPGPSRSQQAPPSHDAPESDDARSRREEEEAAERRRRRRRGPARDSPATTPAATSGSSTPLDGLSATQLQDQASKLLAQTNLLGQSMLNRANAFWKEGKTQVQKAYDERQTTGGGGATGANGKAADGRPKWMVDAEAFEIEEREAAASAGGGAFRDGDDDGDESHQRSNGTRPAGRVTRQASPPRQQQQQQRATEPAMAPVMSAAAKVASLFGGDSEPTAYVSPNRRRPGPSAPTASSSAPPPRAAAAPARPAAPPRRRQVASVPPSAIAAAASHRTNGNDLFKLGRFGDAEAAYSSAVESLPPRHLLAVPLYNNRAAARLKNGDHVGCAADSTTVIEIVGLDYDPEKEVPTDEAQGGAGLGEALVKALTKRASAYEMGEKWAKAKEDWDVLGTLNIGGAVGKASKVPAMDGARRCKKMVDVVSGAAPSQPASTAAAKPKPRPTAPARAPKPTPAPNSAAEGPALARARATASLATSEEAQRADLKDTVEARLSAWSTNKETNLRALLASLDTVLWPELGWQKCGMHELVTDKQVKIRYTRAIGKVHPDKLASLGAGVTVEQRMIAGGVFGVLNEAWRVSQA